MNLKVGMVDEYKRRHIEIWPELKNLLKKSGISKYYIFFDEKKNSLIAIQFLEINNTVNFLYEDPIMKKWWFFMSDIMDHNENYSPIAIEIEKVFDLNE